MAFQKETRVTTEELGVVGVTEKGNASRFSNLSEEGQNQIIEDIMNGRYYTKGDPKEYLNNRKFRREQAVKLFGYMLSGQAGDLFEALEVDAQDTQDSKRPANY